MQFFTLIAIVLSVLALDQDTSEILSIVDKDNYGVRLHLADGRKLDYSKDGEILHVREFSYCEIMGPFKLIDINAKKKVHLSSSDISIGTYQLVKTDDVYIGIAYSEPNFKGYVRYLKSDVTYNSIFKGGVHSLRSNTQIKFRVSSDLAVAKHWPGLICQGRYQKLQVPIRDIYPLSTKCD